MDQNSFNKQLNKISLLAESFNLDNKLSSLERDLLLSYIRDLYESVLAESIDVHNHVAPKVKVAPIEIPVKPIESKVKETVVHAEPKVNEIPKEVIVEPAIEEKVIEPKVEKVEAEKVQPVQKVETSTSQSISSEILAELFAEDKVTELSDKLALSPIKDLTKSMGINERIFTQQELFGNNQAHFVETLEGLNKCQNFDDAKQYLIENVIVKNDWGSDAKLKKATTFIKLVKRKFI
jgi:hypothetical protein